MPRASRLLPLICLLVSLCAPALAAQRGFFAMDTYMAISAEGENAEEALEAAEARVRELEALWSATDEESEIYALDHADGETIAISADTEAILRFGAEMGARTGGCLDITLYPVSRLWGFTTGDYRVPSETELAAALALVGYEQLELSPGAARLPEGAQVDPRRAGQGLGRGRGRRRAARMRRDFGAARPGRQRAGAGEQGGRLGVARGHRHAGGWDELLRAGSARRGGGHLGQLRALLHRRRRRGVRAHPRPAHGRAGWWKTASSP